MEFRYRDSTKVGGELPWEARAWLQVIGARAFSVAFGSETIEQSSGVRQGSPDSPTLFSAGNGEALNEVITDLKDTVSNLKLPATPFGIGAFMDDVYTCRANPRLDPSLPQGSRAALCAKRPRDQPQEDDDHVQPTTTGLIYHRGQSSCEPIGPEAITRVLGSPFTFTDPLDAIIREMQHRARKSFRANRSSAATPDHREDLKNRSPNLGPKLLKDTL